MTNQPEHARPLFANSRLDLPRFRFAPTESSTSKLASPQLSTSPQPRRQPPASVQVAAPTWQASATPLAEHGYASASVTPPVSYPPAPVAAPPAAHAAPAVQQPAPSARQSAPSPVPVMANATRPATISWDRIDPPDAQPTVLQRIKPVHMGALLVCVLVAMVATAGPASMKAPTSLPAVASGGGGVGYAMQPRSAAATPAAATTTPAPARTAGAVAAPSAAGYIAVGSGRVATDISAGGIPSPAAAANLAVAGGGRAPAGLTDTVQMSGIPSPAAAEKLGPQVLPFRPTDGVTLPRTAGERDSYAVDAHYGHDTLAMEAPVELPAMTPGAAAARDEARVANNAVTRGLADDPRANGGLINAY